MAISQSNGGIESESSPKIKMRNDNSNQIRSNDTEPSERGKITTEPSTHWLRAYVAIPGNNRGIEPG